MDEEQIQLTPDQLALVKASASVAYVALKSMIQRVEHNDLDSDFAKTLISTFEHRAADIAKTLGVPSQSEQEIKQRHARIRELNEEVRQLKGLIGQGVTTPAATERVSLVCDALEEWWKETGLGSFVCEPSILRSGVLKAELSINIGGHVSKLFNDKPVSSREQRKARIAELAKVYDLAGEGEHRQNTHLLDNDKNRGLIQRMIKARFPSARIFCFKNQPTDGDAENFVITSIPLYIRKPEEILA